MESNSVVSELVEIKKQLRQQRKLLRWMGVGWLLTASAFLMGAANSHLNFFEDIKVRRLALVDANGIERLILAADSKTAHINGKDWPRASAVSGIILQNVKGDEVGGMGTSSDGVAAIVLDSYSKYTESGGSDRVGLFTTPDGTAAFLLNDLRQNTRALITTDSKMDVTFQLLADDEKPRISGKVSSDGTVTWSN